MLEKALIQADQKEAHRTVSLSVNTKDVPAFFKAFYFYGAGIDVLKISESNYYSAISGPQVKITLSYEFDWELFILGQLFEYKKH